MIAALPPPRTLGVACGTGFLTRHLPGAALVLDDSLALPFPTDSYERVFSAHFYGHLDDADREWRVSKRRFTPGALAAELDGEVLDGGRWFVAVRAR